MPSLHGDPATCNYQPSHHISPADPRLRKQVTRRKEAAAAEPELDLEPDEVGCIVHPLRIPPRPLHPTGPRLLRELTEQTAANTIGFTYGDGSHSAAGSYYGTHCCGGQSQAPRDFPAPFVPPGFPAEISVHRGRRSLDSAIERLTSEAQEK